MGQIKNIKLHIVTDIKGKNIDRRHKSPSEYTTHPSCHNGVTTTNLRTRTKASATSCNNYGSATKTDSSKGRITNSTLGDAHGTPSTVLTKRTTPCSPGSNRKYSSDRRTKLSWRYSTTTKATQESLKSSPIKSWQKTRGSSIWCSNRSQCSWHTGS